jgi:catechol 2,3-dioxygenase-like lactoylglutathione lyase family enzyme
MIRINIASIFVTDQAKAREFYTKVLGFEIRNDIDMGDGNFWLTVGTPGETAVELLLEPSGHPAVGPFRDALLADGIPSTSFAVDDLQAEYERLVALGVRFTQPPTAMGPVTAAVLDDTVGNLIMLAQMN